MRLECFTDLADSDREVDTCSCKHWKINQKSYYSFILIKVLLICFFILIKMYFCINSEWK